MSRARNNVVKLASRKDVERDFGAVDDAAVDSGAALQAALDWASADAAREIEFRGANYLSARQLTAHRARVAGRATLKFSGLGSSTDCLVLQGSAAEAAMVWDGISIDANSTGRDAVVLAGGRAGSTSADFYRLREFRILNAARDGLHIEPSADFHWIEDFRVVDVRVSAPGRHGVAVIQPARASTFINQGVFDGLEVRGAGRTTAGAYDLYCDSQGSSAGQKISEIELRSCEFDVAGAANHAQGCIYLGMSGSSSAYDGWTAICVTPEDTGSVITGFPAVIQTGGAPSIRGLFWRGGVPTKFGQVIDPAATGWCDIDVGSSGRRIVKRSMTSLGFASSYANDAAAAVAGVPVGGEYRNGSVLQVRVA